MKTLHLLFVLYVTASDKIRYDNHLLYKVVPLTDQNVNDLDNLYQDHAFKFWLAPSYVNRTVSIQCPLERKRELESFLTLRHLDWKLVIDNIQKRIDEQPIASYARKMTHSIAWNAYYRLEDINDWMVDICEEAPHYAQLIIAGKSHEGKDIKGVKIHRDEAGEYKEIVVVEGGIHGREWISPLFVTYLIYHLIHDTDPLVTIVARKFAWHVFPTVNPDGYEYTHARDRLWFKNRRVLKQGFGVDLNKNFESNWLNLKSTDPEMFPGTSPFSEEETRSFSGYLLHLKNKITMYISIHSYGQYILVPFANTSRHLSNYAESTHLASDAEYVQKKLYNTKYMIGAVGEMFRASAGSSTDWVKENLNVPFVYTFLTRDDGENAYFIPANLIKPTCEETLSALVTLAMGDNCNIELMSSATKKEIGITLCLGVFVALYALCLNMVHFQDILL